MLRTRAASNASKRGLQGREMGRSWEKDRSRSGGCQHGIRPILWLHRIGAGFRNLLHADHAAFANRRHRCNVAFITYASIDGLTPILILHGALLPLNLLRLLQIRDLNVQVAQAATHEFSAQAILPFMRRRNLRADETLFAANDVAEELYYVVEGELFTPELQQTVGPGSFDGEVALFSSTAFLKERVELAEASARRRCSLRVSGTASQADEDVATSSHRELQLSLTQMEKSLERVRERRRLEETGVFLRREDQGIAQNVVCGPHAHLRMPRLHTLQCWLAPAGFTGPDLITTFRSGASLPQVLAAWPQAVTGARKRRFMHPVGCTVK